MLKLGKECVFIGWVFGRKKRVNFVVRYVQKVGENRQIV